MLGDVLVEGTALGMTDGISLGLSDCKALGMADGMTLGMSLELSDGMALETTLGLLDGLSDGPDDRSWHSPHVSGQTFLGCFDHVRVFNIELVS